MKRALSLFIFVSLSSCAGESLTSMAERSLTDYGSFIKSHFLKQRSSFGERDFFIGLLSWAIAEGKDEILAVELEESLVDLTEVICEEKCRVVLKE